MDGHINKKHTVAVVGAGVAGLRCASLLMGKGYDVTVFEKSRGTGGRLASVRLGELSVDLGAPWIEPVSHDFRQWLMMQGPHLSLWRPNASDFSLNKVFVDRQVWVPVPRSSMITRHLLQNINFHPSVRVAVAWPDRDGVLLRDERAVALGHFDKVVIATPAPQAAPLLDAVQRYRQKAEAVVQKPCWVLLVSLDKRPEKLANIDVVEGEHKIFARIIRDSSKPQRDGEVWVLQANDAWSSDYVNLSPETVGQVLLAGFQEWLSQTLQPTAVRVHRWLYSEACVNDEHLSLWDAESGIGACGDWLVRGGLEGAWRSGSSLAEKIMDEHA
ncbi:MULTISPECIES: NAD(P)/FAD-dependent oxidoreductase [Nitrincola]|uniref:Dehydrosqualene desaturase n=1 Tax=Nitrincola nitratireducens TaxID=1229521 RepID=W9V195_9GAMM|nr:MULTISPECIES: FAD-dependent oxidoreductase [Nitrincola]EXJ09887.1 Dehydrosqualene desaturase [Nitrincola nitratireducens]